MDTVPLLGSPLEPEALDKPVGSPKRPSQVRKGRWPCVHRRQAGPGDRGSSLRARAFATKDEAAAGLLGSGN